MNSLWSIINIRTTLKLRYKSMKKQRLCRNTRKGVYKNMYSVLWKFVRLCSRAVSRDRIGKTTSRNIIIKSKIQINNDSIVFPPSRDNKFRLILTSVWYFYMPCRWWRPSRENSKTKFRKLTRHDKSLAAFSETSGTLVCITTSNSKIAMRSRQTA